MTLDELRSLADGVTQWQWHWDDDDGMSVEFHTEGDRRLIALAPDLARLCADMADELRTSIAIFRKETQDLLTRLSELKA